MELRDLATFYEISKVQKFSTASNVLHCAESTLSIRIKNLENELGAHLFERGAKGTILSEEGKLLLPYVEKIMHLIDEAKQSIQDWSISENGCITLASSHYVSHYQLPRIVHAFKNTYPDIEFRIRIGNTAEVIEMISNREAQIGLTRGPVNDESMEAIKIAEEPILLCVYPGHPFSGFSSVDLKIINHIPIISYKKGLGYWNFLYQTFQQVGFEPRVYMEFDSMETIKEMVIEQIGIALLPLSVIREEMEQGSLIALEIENPPSLKRATYVFYPKRKNLTGPLKTFFEICQQKLH